MSSKKIKYIFCISTGRCGTQYLAQLLGTLRDCNSFHEQSPRMNKSEMRDYLRGKKKPIQRLMPKKFKAINATAGVLYADTTHVFIKSFGWEISKYILQENIGVIILKRDIDEVAESIHRTQSGPFNDLGRDWIICPNGNNLVRPPSGVIGYRLNRFLLKALWKIKGNSGEKKYSPSFKKKSLKLIKWYYRETYARAEKYKKEFPKMSYVEVSLDELNTIEGFEKIVTAFDLKKLYNKKKVESLLRKPVNLKSPTENTLQPVK